MNHITSTHALLATIAMGAAPKYLCFWGHTPAQAGMVDKSCLSQWYPAPFEVAGERYATAEHCMMAGKARLFGDEAAAQRVLAARTPGEAKQIGREVQGFDSERWETARFDIVVQANLAKFGQHAELGAFLLGTGERVLVEASPVDAIWGIGLAADSPDAQVPARWLGLNLLGFALMQARARLRQG